MRARLNLPQITEILEILRVQARWNSESSLQLKHRVEAEIEEQDNNRKELRQKVVYSASGLIKTSEDQ